MGNTIFHKIINREIPAEIVFEDDLVIAIKDIQPVSPVHILIIPKKTLPSAAQATREDQSLLGHIMLTAANIAREQGLENDGYRLVVNTGENGGQTVPQFHLHLVGGRLFGWPPG